MRAVTLAQNDYQLRDCKTPVPAAGEVVIKVAYAGLNRADLLQKQGRYPLPEQNPAIPGMEFSGTIAACGSGVSTWKIGDRVCGLVSEGAFAEYVCAPAAQLLHVTDRVTLEQAAALPEACFTVWISFVWQAHVRPGETVLVHGGTSGIGSIAIQMAKQLGANVLATAGSAEKCALCESLGAQKAIPYKTDDYMTAVKAATGGRGVDVILDMVGGDYFERNLSCLAEGGRLCIIAFLKGAKVNANLAPILLKHLSVMGSTLRPRSAQEKAQIARELSETIWPAVAKGAIKPVIDRIFSLDEAEKALDRMDRGLNIGKILLKI